MKAKSLHFSKSGSAQQIAAELGRVLNAYVIKFRLHIPVRMKRLFLSGLKMNGHLEKAVKRFAKI